MLTFYPPPTITRAHTHTGPLTWQWQCISVRKRKLPCLCPAPLSFQDSQWNLFPKANVINLLLFFYLPVLRSLTFERLIEMGNKGAETLQSEGWGGFRGTVHRKCVIICNKERNVEGPTLRMCICLCSYCCIVSKGGCVKQGEFSKWN